MVKRRNKDENRIVPWRVKFVLGMTLNSSVNFTVVPRRNILRRGGRESYIFLYYNMDLYCWYYLYKTKKFVGENTVSLSSTNYVFIFIITYNLIIYFGRTYFRYPTISCIEQLTLSQTRFNLFTSKEFLIQRNTRDTSVRSDGKIRHKTLLHLKKEVPTVRSWKVSVHWLIGFRTMTSRFEL